MPRKHAAHIIEVSKELVTCVLILENEPPKNSQLMRGHDIHKDYARDALMFHALIDKEQQSTTVELGI